MYQFVSLGTIVLLFTDLTQNELRIKNLFICRKFILFFILAFNNNPFLLNEFWMFVFCKKSFYLLIYL